MSKRGEMRTVAGVGAAACVACCAGPILGVLAALGFGAAATMLLGIAGLAIGAAVTAVVVARRHRSRRLTCGIAPQAVTITPLRRRV
jgi:hypothetical protein